MRSQSSPEVHDVTFEQSPDMATWTALGQASWISGGWQLGGLTLPIETTFYVRARGRGAGGYLNASTGLVESVRQCWIGGLSISDVSSTKGNAGTTAFTFTVTLSKASTGTVTVNYATADGTAKAISDYTATSGTLTFTAGQTSKRVTVNVTGDAAVEPNETFFVNLSNATGATIADGQGLGTIVNDGGPVLRINDVSRAEGNSATTAFAFPVTLSPASTGTVTVHYATANGTA